MPDLDTWKLEGFLDRLDAWVAREAPPDELRVLVTAWIMSRYDDPYQGVQRERDFENLWFGPIPGSVTKSGTVVVCAYWIKERNRKVRCESFATLPVPT
ncbi:hypothetical protein [Catelliglobosispora koreensis]|uniref:hypothetical protein n=1 Tax=Catelliglobosispora koreensis TaxID=129052 RepID=UPI0003822487|nr:hypothetical protein [Catelliglobosispora koreensis]